jgi:hypothetical protein
LASFVANLTKREIFKGKKMDSEEDCLDSDQFLHEVKKTIDFRKPPRTITVCEGAELKVNIVSPSNENDNSVDQTASIDTNSFEGLSDIEIQDALDQVSKNVDVSSERYVIETGNNNDSFPSRVSILEDDEDECYEELQLVVRTLYKHLQKVDAELEMERSRRQSREKSLISLAKELVSGKEMIAKQSQRIEEVRKTMTTSFSISRTLTLQLTLQQHM